MSNPFFHGNPVSPDQFLDRRRELRRIVSRIANQGQSTAIVGEPRTGKTSLLEYLAAPELRAELYGADGDQFLFTYLDAQTLGVQFSQAQFWEYALRPLHQQAVIPDREAPLAQAYEVCRENGFGAFVLERLLAQMEQAGWRLVLMLDEFDVLLQHPILNSAEFFGSLRSLASRSRGALALVIASRHPLERLNKEAQELSRTGSPYLNFLTEITLGPWPESAVDELLRWAGERFAAGDRLFIKEAAGGHPYLLQTAASILWEVYEDAEGTPALQRQHAGRDLLDSVATNLQDTWRLWLPETRRAIIAAALAHINALGHQPDRSDPGTYSVAAICSLMRDSFTAQEIRRFCRDRPPFSPVLDQLSPSASLEDTIDVLVEYCNKRLLFAELLSEIQGFNPRQYDRYASQVQPERFAGLSDLGPELRLLEKQGFIMEDAAISGGWRVRPQVLLWWLADELASAIQSEQTFVDWLQEQVWEGSPVRGGRQPLSEFFRASKDSLKGGASILIAMAAAQSR